MSPNTVAKASPLRGKSLHSKGKAKLASKRQALGWVLLHSHIEGVSYGKKEKEETVLLTSLPCGIPKIWSVSRTEKWHRVTEHL